MQAQREELANEQMSARAKVLITTGAFLALGFMGMSRTFLGTALSAIRSDLGLSLLRAGSLPAMTQLGFSIAVFLGGPLSDYLNKKRLLIVGLSFLGITLVLFGVSPVFWVNLSLVILMGIGGGLIESSSNPLIIRLYSGRESPMMNLHHFFFAAGSLIGPVLMGTVLARGVPWRFGYLGFGCLVILIPVMLLFTGKLAAERGQKLDLKVIKQVLGNRTLQTFLLLLFLSQGVQNGVAYWMVTFLREVRGFPIASASVSLSLFFVCLAIGRLFTSYLIRWFREIPYILGLLCLLAAALFLAIIIKGKLAILFFAICGLFHSGVFPISLGVIGRIFPENPGTPMGLLATAAGLGATGVPWFMSLVSELTTLQKGFMFFEYTILFCIGFLVLKSKRLAPAKPLRGREIG